MKAKPKTVQERKLASEVRDVERRLASTEIIVRMQGRIQTQSLANAEKLKKLAEAVVAPRKVADKTYIQFVSIHAFNALRAFLKDLPAFHKPPKGKVPDFSVEAERDAVAVAKAVLSMAKSGGMPDGYFDADSRVKRARAVLEKYGATNGKKATKP